MIALLLLSAGCFTKSSNTAVDNDNDGIEEHEDCNDSDANIGLLFWYADNDGDGYGEYSSLLMQCEKPSGYVDNFADCNDEDGNINAYAVEVCDGIDNNCDGLIDDLDTDLDMTSTTIYYLDLDGDGYGNPNTAQSFCVPPPAYIADNSDCNDSESTINSAATEICDTIDNDCDGDIDDDDDSLDTSTGSAFYADTDNDGYGDPNSEQAFCQLQNGYVENSSDCDDSNDMSYPQATEFCDNKDNNCNGTVDENPADGTVFYIDYDADGFGKPGTEVLACSAPTNYTANALDCNDFDSAINPDATEICNNVDDDCNPLTTEEGLVTQMSNPPVNVTVSQDATNPSSHLVTTTDTWNFCEGTYYPTFTIEQSVTFSGIGSQPILSGTNMVIIGIYESLVDFTLENISIQDFNSGSSWSSAIVCDTAASTVSLENLLFSNNIELVSGLIRMTGCDFYADTVSFQNNTGFFLYGISTSESNVYLTDVTFDQNTSSIVGAFAGTDSSVELGNIAVTNENAAKPLYFNNSDVTCQNALFENNDLTSSNGIVQLLDNSTFTSTQCSFGTGISDNTPFDISTETHQFMAGDNVDFSCQGNLCGTVEDETLGQGTYSAESNLSSRIRGNFFEVNGYPTLDSFGMYFSCGLTNTLCMNRVLNFYVHTRSNSTDPWQLRWHEPTNFTWWNNSFVYSSTIGLALFDGEQVALSVGWEDDVTITYYYDSTTNFSMQNIGMMEGSVHANSISDINDPAITTYNSNIYKQDIRTLTLE